MSISRQKTLKNPISCAGVGLHGGLPVHMTLLPAAADTGIVFRRTDLGGVVIAARHENVSDTVMCTTLSNGEGVRIGTVEHLMAAFAGTEIDNLVVEIDGPEVPIMDGSAAPFVLLIECAGVAEQTAPRRAIRVLRTIAVTDGRRSVSLSPAEGCAISFEIDFDHPLVGRQSCDIDLDNGGFKRELSRARTFGFEAEIEDLHARGLGLGGSLDNAVIVGDDGVLNDGGLRFGNEFVRHKALDCIGDLYLAGAPILAHVRGVRSGHTMNHRLLRALFADHTAWCTVILGEALPVSADAGAAIAANA